MLDRIGPLMLLAAFVLDAALVRGQTLLHASTTADNDHTVAENAGQAPTERRWHKIFADRRWYLYDQQREEVYVGILQRNERKNLSPRMHQMPYRYRWGDSYIYTDNKPNAVLESLLARKVEIRGKVYDRTFQGQFYKEIRPGAVRLAETPNEAASLAAMPVNGWELYVWRQNGNVYCSLIECTDRLKSDNEILQAAVREIDAIKPKLAELASSERVAIFGRRWPEPPPRDEAKVLEDYCRLIGLQVQADCEPIRPRRHPADAG